MIHRTFDETLQTSYEVKGSRFSEQRLMVSSIVTPTAAGLPHIIHVNAQYMQITLEKEMRHVS
jgi:hypothetical protein